MAGVTITTDGNSDWVSMKRGVDYRVDVTASTWGGSTAVGLETATESGLPITVKKPDDSAAAFSATENDGLTIRGPGRVRAVTTSYSGSADLQIVVEPSQC